MGASKPVLWHIPVSHFSEKARWALEYKGIEHQRRTPVAGAHMAVALWHTRGASKTLPMLRMDGETLADSTDIIAALERRHPEPALYPADPEQRRRALELEEFFDEHLGPSLRLAAWHALRSDPERMAALTTKMVPRRMRERRLARSGARRFGNAFVAMRYQAGSEERAERARGDVLAALDRLEAELDAGDGEYLAGGSFSVADLTAAALFYPMVLPPAGPQFFTGQPESLEPFIAPLRERPGYRWVEGIYRRHRAGPAHESSTIASTSTGTSNGS